MICLLCLPFLAIWTSPKSNVSMVNWLADCRFVQDSVAGPKKSAKPKKAATSMAALCTPN